MNSKLLLIAALSLSFFSNSISAQNSPFPQNKVYGNGLMPSNRNSQDALNTYNIWKSNFVTACSNGRYRVKFDDQSQTVSEGIAYGMLLAAYAGDKTLFDGFWLYYKDFRNSHGVMHWKIGGCTSVVGSNGATDAEVDVALALIVAHNQWGSAGSINYSADGKTLIAAMKAYEIESGSLVLKPGDMFGGSNLTNPSYFAPGYFRIFGSFTNDAVFWNGAASKCYQVINSNLSVNAAKGGLVSDWCQANGAYSSSAGGYYNGGQRYHYDAARTPWRIAVDYAWNGSAEGQSYSLKTSDFVRVTLGGTKNVKDGYYQNGSAYGQWHNSTFVGAFACAAIAGGNQSHLDASYADLVSINDASSYFNHTLKTLYMFLLTGNFYSPSPTTTTPPANIAPSVSITSPANNAAFASGTTINISANASDSDGSISKVEFFQGSTKLGEDLTSPFTYSWANVATGNYTLTAKATDNAGAVTTSESVAIAVSGVSAPVNTAIKVSITSPAGNSIFIAGTTIVISANASMRKSTISKVEFFYGSAKIGEDLTSPYSISWPNVQAGTYVLTARATNKSGSVNTSALVPITVNPLIQSSTQSAFGGTSWAIPGLIEAEKYDNGGNTIAYYDVTSGNTGTAFRNDNVDIETTADMGGGYSVGWIDAGEWLEYTVNVSAASKYDFNIRVASPYTLKKLHIEINGVNVTNSIAVPQTGSWYTWSTVKVAGISLSSGTQVMRIFMETDGFNLNSVEVVKSAVARLNTNPTEEIVLTDFAVFPNPTHGQLMLVNDNITEKEITISISNIIGQELIYDTYINTESYFDQLLDISHLGPGLYILRVNSGNKIWTNKIIKQ